MKVGDKNNQLTYVREAPPKIRSNGIKRTMGVFKCECGNESIKEVSTIRIGYIKSCIKCANKRKGKKKHGLINHPLYKKWADMKKRCYNKNVDRYPNYGGRGIKVCDEWNKSFKSFYNWSIKNGWKEGLTIERLNINGNYEPDNCKYIPFSHQKYNKINTFYVIHKGIKVPLIKILEENNKEFLYSIIWHGIKKGKTFSYYTKKYNIS